MPRERVKELGTVPNQKTKTNIKLAGSGNTSPRNAMIEPNVEIHLHDNGEDVMQFDKGLGSENNDCPSKEPPPIFNIKIEENRMCSSDEDGEESMDYDHPYLHCEPILEMNIGETSWTEKNNPDEVKKVNEEPTSDEPIVTQGSLAPTVKPKRKAYQKPALVTSPQNEEFTRCISSTIRDASGKRLPLTCDHCNAKYRCRAEMFRHMISQHINKNLTCHRCGESFSRHDDLRVHMRKYPVDPFACEFCGAVFILKINLTNHIRIHTGERPYECRACGQRFVKSFPLKVHMRTAHTGEKPFVCTKCPAAFVTRTLLNIHMKRQHMERERAFKCAHCELAFYDMVTLTDHTRTHTGEKPYVCEFCNRGFAQRYALRSHRNIHTGNMPCKCKYCDRAFRSSAARRWHEKTVHKDVKKDR